MCSATLSFSPLSEACGAEVDVDMRTLSAGDVAALRDLLAERGVLVLRGQAPTPEEHLAFARLFGPVVTNRLLPASAEHPEIAEVRKTETQRANVGGGWHTDHSYDAQPAMGSILVARELPPVGGDTLFVGMARVYAAMDKELRSRLDGLRAVHSTERHFGLEGAYARTSRADDIKVSAQASVAVHPVVIRHPVSGSPVLFVNPAFTLHFEGQTREESRDLLMSLFRLAQEERFQCRLTWRPGDVAIWDNRSTMHRALNDYHGHARLMHRVTVAGCALAAHA